MEAPLTLDMAATFISAGRTFEDHPKLQTEQSDEHRYRSSAKKMRGPIRKSCNMCFRRKKKCDGDGINRCSYCASRGLMDCMYDGRMQAAEVRARQKRLISGEEKGGAPRNDSSTFPRCRMSASLATGLVGMEENALLRDFFTCLGNVPLTNPSEIRGAMVNIMSSSGPNTTPGHGIFVASGISPPSLWNDSVGEARTGVAQASSNAMVCTFWSSIALGGLLQGRSESLVTRYLRLAEDALLLCEGQAVIEVARALGTMALLYSFLARDQDDVAACLEHRLRMIHDVETEESKQMIGEEFTSYVQHTSLDEIESFLERASQFFGTSDQSSAKPWIQSMDLSDGDLHAIAIEVGTSVWSIILNTMKKAPLMHTRHEIGTQVESPPNSDDEGLITGSGRRFEANAPGSRGGPARYAPLRAFIQGHMGDVVRLRREAKRPALQTYVAIILDGFLSLIFVALDDRESAVEATYRMVDTFTRYPGLGRFAVFRALYTFSTLVLASIGDHATYDELASGFNALWNDEKDRIPPLEERLERFLWDDILWSRVQEQFLREYGWGAVASPDVSSRPRGAGSRDHRTPGCRGIEINHFITSKDCHDAHCSRTSREEASVSAPEGVSWTGTIDYSYNQVPIVVDANDWNHLADTLQA